MANLYKFLKEYIVRNYSDAIVDEEHAESVARGIEFYLTDKLIPETISDMAPVTEKEELSNTCIGCGKPIPIDHTCQWILKEGEILPLHFDCKPKEE